MRLDKAIEHGKEKRKPYYGTKQDIMIRASNAAHLNRDMINNIWYTKVL